MKPLLILTALLIGLPAFGQSTWRNFWTTNQNPIVDVVAGSNATVQASVIGVDHRRFTVNAVPTAGQTNNVVVAALTNIVVATNVSGGNTIYSIGGIPQTNISVLGITNGGYLTNWSLVPTNYIPTSSGFVTNATLTNQIYASNIVSGGQVTLVALSTNTPIANQVLVTTSPTTSKWTDRVEATVGAILTTAYSTSAQYVSLTGSTGGTATEGRASTPWPVPATFTNMISKISTAPPAGTNYTITLMTNGVASNLSATIVGDGNILRATNTTSSVFVDFGTTVSIRYQGNNASASGNLGILWAVGYFQQ